jgi:hypothetical protein
VAQTDPQVVVVDDVNDTSCPRVTTGPTSAVYKSADGTVELSISHNSAKRNRSSVRLHVKKNISDPLITGVSRPVDMAVTLIVDRPLLGYTNAEAKHIVSGVDRWINHSSGVYLDKFLGFES